MLGETVHFVHVHLVCRIPHQDYEKDSNCVIGVQQRVSQYLGHKLVCSLLAGTEAMDSDICIQYVLLSN